MIQSRVRSSNACVLFQVFESPAKRNMRVGQKFNHLWSLMNGHYLKRKRPKRFRDKE